MTGSRFFSLPVAATLLSLAGVPLATLPALAQAVPDALNQELLIKTSLLTFNDANVTGNYDVFHAKLAKPFRDQFSPEKLKTIFKAFHDKQIDFDFIVVKQPIADEPASVDENGTLKINGHFDSKPNWVKYQLKYIRSDGEWKVVGIDVNLSAPPDAAGPKAGSAKGEVK
jgi:hypothetical protein